jgi:SAV_6107-like HEPN
MASSNDTNRVGPAVLALVKAARRGLDEAAGETAPGARYVTAHLAALRAAAAIVAARGQSSSGRSKPRSVWEMLPQAEPSLAEWAAHFAAGAGRRAAAEAGLPRAAALSDADALLRDAQTFVTAAEAALGIAA